MKIYTLIASVSLIALSACSISHNSADGSVATEAGFEAKTGYASARVVVNGIKTELAVPQNGVVQIDAPVEGLKVNGDFNFTVRVAKSGAKAQIKLDNPAAYSCVDIICEKNNLVISMDYGRCKKSKTANNKKVRGEIVLPVAPSTVTASLDAELLVAGRVAVTALNLFASTDATIQIPDIDVGTLNATVSTDANIITDKVLATTINACATTDGRLRLPDVNSATLNLVASTDGVVEANGLSQTVNSSVSTDGKVVVSGQTDIANFNAATDGRINAERLIYSGGSLYTRTDGKVSVNNVGKLTFGNSTSARDRGRAKTGGGADDDDIYLSPEQRSNKILEP